MSEPKPEAVATETIAIKRNSLRRRGVTGGILNFLPAKTNELLSRGRCRIFHIFILATPLEAPVLAVKIPMKIIRYQDSQQHIFHGWQSGDGRYFKISGDIFGRYSATDELADVAKLLAPVAPSSILCIGLNYRKHAEETKGNVPEYPILFMKGLNAVQNPADAILIPRFLPSERVDYECELAVVIGRVCKNVRRAQAFDYVLGYTCANDVSARDWQIKWGGSQWCRGKTFDTFAPLGPCLVTPDEIPDPNALPIRTLLNGEAVQDSNTNDMIFDVPAIIEFLSGSTTLLPGTVILTGTPQGVGMARKPPLWLKPGDEVTIEIEGIGRLTNPVEMEPVAEG
jgi:2-keto-4-pentenoate hydratase/2-oxohepta-3-ene-1,7-dioic acid hydratase in catechol pathway